MNENNKIVLDHGTGAKLSHELISFITEVLEEVHIGKMEDSAILPIEGKQIAVTTDSFVVTPAFFGNGDIGKIAVCGTVNDIAVSGAKPLYLTLAMILETGFPIKELKTIIESVRDISREAGIKIVAGDTKVVDKGEADKIFINTTGIGVFETPPLYSKNVKPKDKIIVTSFLGNHSIHILSIREGLGFEKRILSDCAPLNHIVKALRSSELNNAIHSIRDITRGGLCGVLHEYSHVCRHTLSIFENDLPIQMETKMAADMLGVNPLHLANEGCLCIFVSPDKADETIELLKQFEYSKNSVIIGEVTEEERVGVTITNKEGRSIAMDELEGAELPRLC